MNITKLNHSSLLVEAPESGGRTALFDPGKTTQEAFDPARLPRLDDIIITNNFGDALNVGLIKKLIRMFPNLQIVAPEAVGEQLWYEGVDVEDRGDLPDDVELFTTHKSYYDPLASPDTIGEGVHYLHLFTHPGDSLEFNESKAVLALPVDGSWGATMQAAKKAVRLHPQYVVPVHDVMWNNQWRNYLYMYLRQIFTPYGIKVVKLQEGQAKQLIIRRQQRQQISL
jgi:L-ascorbate metabolism protein UlaG (beta-lactamase superfamily)